MLGWLLVWLLMLNPKLDNSLPEELVVSRLVNEYGDVAVRESLLVIVLGLLPSMFELPSDDRPMFMEKRELMLLPLPPVVDALVVLLKYILFPLMSLEPMRTWWPPEDAELSPVVGEWGMCMLRRVDIPRFSVELSVDMVLSDELCTGEFSDMTLEGVLMFDPCMRPRALTPDECRLLVDVLVLWLWFWLWLWLCSMD